MDSQVNKNHPFVGGTSSSLADDNDNWNKLLNMTLLYKFSR